MIDSPQRIITAFLIRGMLNLLFMLEYNTLISTASKITCNYTRERSLCLVLGGFIVQDIPLGTLGSK